MLQSIFMSFYKYTLKAILSKPCGHALMENMNEEGIRRRIRALLDAIQNEADPVVLIRCRSIFRQEVSFFHRSYMAAYLLLLAEEGKTIDTSAFSGKGGRSAHLTQQGASNLTAKGSNGFSLKSSRRDKRDDRDKRGGKEHPAEASRFLSEEESVRLFVSIGRNRKVFPREILALINANTQVTRDDIGIIRILDNYSLIQVRTAVADTVITALNGRNFRGRTLTVNYARSRRDGDEEGDIQSSAEDRISPQDDVPPADTAETSTENQ
jgi:hypothetical protein